MSSLPAARSPARSVSTRTAARVLVALVFLGTAIFALYGSLTLRDGAYNQLLVAAISLYLFLECWYYLSRCDDFGLLAPVFLASIAHFYLAYLLPTAGTIVDPWIQARYDEYFRSFQDDIGDALLTVGLSAFCMWRGYYFGTGFGRRFGSRLRSVSALRQEFRPRLGAAVAVQLGYLLVVSYAIALGVFGISSSAAAREANLALIDYLNLGLAAGSLSFLLLMTHLFRRLDAGEFVPLLRVGCIAMTIMHLLVGAVAGFKSQLVMPFVMITLASFLVRHRISFVYVIGGLAALLVAYQVIEPYRAYLGRNSVSGGADMTSMIDTLQKSWEQRDLGYQSDVPVGTQILQRFDLTSMSAIGLAQFGDDPLAIEKGREMAETIYLAPLLAYAPRALWPGKPTYQTGAWFNQYLGTFDNDTSVGMGPIAWLFMVGGTAGVIVGFFCIGWLQALVFEGFARAGAGGIVVFLAAANVLVLLPTEVGSSFVGMMRLLPIAFVAQWALLQQATKGRR